MQYLRSLQFIMDREKWMMNILLVAVCLFIPVIGQIVVMGYIFEIIDALNRDPEHKNYPDFDFGLFMDYLKRGIWPWLMQLVLGLIIGVPLGMVFGCCGMIGGILAASMKSQIISLLVQMLMFVVGLVVGVLASLVTVPANIQAGLAREFNFGNMWTAVKAFNQHVRNEILISMVFLIAIALAAEMLGCMACGVGIFITFAVVILAQGHVFF